MNVQPFFLIKKMFNVHSSDKTIIIAHH